MYSGPMIRVFARQALLLLSVMLMLFAARAEAQVFEVSKAGENTIRVEVRDGYSWVLEERSDNRWVTARTGGSGTHIFNLTRPYGLHEFRLYNCFPMNYGCSTLPSQSVNLAGPLIYAPSSITVTPNVNNNSFAISWPAASGATHYQLNHGDTKLQLSSNRSFTFTGASADVSYTFKVQSCNSYTCSYFRSASPKTITRPTPPGSLSVTPNSSNNTFDISWSAVSGDVTHYELYMSGEGVSTVNGLSATRSGTPGTATTFQIKACNGMNCSANRNATSTIPLPVVPTAPTISSSITSGSITINWSAPNGADSYQLKRGSTTLNPSGRTYKDTNVSPGSSYTYRVRACNATGQCSSWRSKTVSYPPRPATPQFTSIAMDGSAVLVKWNSVSYATSYRLVRDIRSWNTSALQRRDTTVSEGNSYTYTLKACNAASVCSSTASQQFTVPVSIPVPATPTVTAQFGGASVAVNWNQPAHAASYRLTRNDVVISHTGNSHIDMNIEANRTYTYKVRACNANNQCSEGSATIFIPNEPLFDVVVTGDNTFSVHVGNVSIWTVQEEVNGNWVSFQTGPATPRQTFNYTRPSGVYKFRLNNCYSQEGNCSTSGEEEIYLAGSPPPVPEVTAEIVEGELAVLVEWNQPAGAVTYELRRTDKPTNHPALASGNFPGGSFIDTSVIAGQSYSYHLKVCDVDGDCSTGTAGSGTVPYPKPATPQFTSIAMDGSAVLVKWNAVLYATSYQLVRGSLDWNTSELEGRDTAVSEGNTYTYTLKACNAANVCSESVSQQFTVPVSTPVPAAPTVTVQFGGASVAVNWNQPAHATSYQLKRNDVVISHTGNSHIDRTIEANRTYTYKVSACNANNQCSEGSATVFIPNEPLFDVVVTGNNTFSVHVGNVSSWTVYEEVDGNWVSFQTGPATPRQTFDYTRPSGVYKFRLHNCYSQVGNCSTSGDEEIYLRGTPPPMPVVTAEAVEGELAILVEWNQPAGAVSYELRRTDKTSKDPALAADNFPGGSFIDTSVIAGQPYSYHVKVCDVDNDCSIGAAGPVTVTEPPPPSLDVPVVSAELVGDSIHVSWSQPEGADTYQLNRSGTSPLLLLPKDTYTSDSYTDSNIVEGGTYTYDVTVCNAENDCEMGSSLPVTVPDSTSSLVAPEVSAELVENSIHVSWSQPTEAVTYQLDRSGTSLPLLSAGPHPTASYIDSNIVAGETYIYSVTACSSPDDCLVGSSSPVTVPGSPSGDVVINYTYDALGRLTFVEDSHNGNRDYDYDPVGNRLKVSTGGADDSTSEPQPPGVTLGVSPPTLIGDCAWRAEWDETPEATYYEFKTTQNASITLYTNTIDVACPTDNPEANKPQWVRSCNSVGCGPTAYFE